MSMFYQPNPERFAPYPKTGRLSKAECTITEKIDGTNAQVTIEGGVIVGVGSRKRAIDVDVPALRDENGRTVRDDEGKPVQPKQVRDNFGFAQFVRDNAQGLVEFLCDGTHYGEWAGPGIQKNPLGLDERFFFLFNVQRHPAEKFAALGHLVPNLRPVPILYRGDFGLGTARSVLLGLMEDGTAVPEAAYSNQGPEGIVISAFGTKFKMTMDDSPKGARS